MACLLAHDGPTSCSDDETSQACKTCVAAHDGPTLCSADDPDVDGKPACSQR